MCKINALKMVDDLTAAFALSVEPHTVAETGEANAAGKAKHTDTYVLHL